MKRKLPWIFLALVLLAAGGFHFLQVGALAARNTELKGEVEQRLNQLQAFDAKIRKQSLPTKSWTETVIVRKRDHDRELRELEGLYAQRSRLSAHFGQGGEPSARAPDPLDFKDQYGTWWRKRIAELEETCQVTDATSIPGKLERLGLKDFGEDPPRPDEYAFVVKRHWIQVAILEALVAGGLGRPPEGSDAGAPLPMREALLGLELGKPGQPVAPTTRLRDVPADESGLFNHHAFQLKLALFPQHVGPVVERLLGIGDFLVELGGVRVERSEAHERGVNQEVVEPPVSVTITGSVYEVRVAEVSQRIAALPGRGGGPTPAPGVAAGGGGQP